MGQINEVSIKYFNKLIETHKDREIQADSDLIKEIREFANKEFLIPFVESFVNYISKKGLRVNSKYLLKILIQNETRLYNRDLIANRIGTELNDEDYILINDYVILCKGTIIKQFMLLNLNRTLNNIKSKIKGALPNGLKSEPQFLFELVNKEKIIDLIYDEMDSIGNRKLIEDISAY